MEWWRRRRLLTRIRLEWGAPRLKTRDMPAIASYHAALTATHPEASIDSRTWDDLGLDDVFALIDRTESSIGQQRLYHRLRSRDAVKTLDAFEALVDAVANDRPNRELYQLALSRLADASGYQVWSLAQPGALEVRPWHAVFPIAAMTVLTIALMSLVQPPILMLLAVIGPACLAVRLANAKRIGRVIETFRFIGPLIATAKAISPIVRAEHAGLTEPLRADIGELHRLRVLSGWLTRDALAMDPLTGTAIELLNTLLLLDANALLLGAFELRRRGRALERVLAAVGEVDAAIAIGSYRAGLAVWTRPVLRRDVASVAIRELRHPLLPDGVPNSIQFAPPHGVLITGSNMSGKSTFLRAFGLAAVLSQTVNTCTAASYEAPSLVIRSCIGRRDDLLEGKSYFLDEVQAVIGVLAASRSPGMHLFLFDELFRGTNAMERVAASEATLRHLATTSHLVIAATHDVEVVRLLDDVYTAFYFVDRAEAGGLVFEYKLAAGASTTRNAIALLEGNGAPLALVARARELAARIESDRKR